MIKTLLALVFGLMFPFNSHAIMGEDLMVEVVCKGQTVAEKPEAVRIVIYGSKFKDSKSIQVEAELTLINTANYFDVRRDLLTVKTRPDFIANPAPAERVGLKYFSESDKLEIWIREDGGTHRFKVKGNETIHISSCDKFVEVLQSNNSNHGH